MDSRKTAGITHAPAGVSTVSDFGGKFWRKFSKANFGVGFWRKIFHPGLTLCPDWEAEPFAGQIGHRFTDGKTKKEHRCTLRPIDNGDL